MMHFAPKVENVLGGLPAAQSKAIRHFGELFCDNTHSLAYPIRLGQGSQEMANVTNHAFEMTDIATSIINRLALTGFELSELEPQYQDTGKDRLAISRLADPVITLFKKSLPEVHENYSQRTAIGLVGVHAAIWTPEKCLKKPALAPFAKARDEYVRTVLIPTRRLYRS